VANKAFRVFKVFKAFRVFKDFKELMAAEKLAFRVYKV
jgi:hypothetical protein